MCIYIYQKWISRPKSLKHLVIENKSLIYWVLLDCYCNMIE